MKKTLVSIFSLALLLVAIPAFAEETFNTSEVGKNLKAQHQELKAQVDAGKITREAAQASWQSIIEEARANKDAYFAKRMEKLDLIIEKISEKNPEKAAELQEKKRAAIEYKNNRDAQRQTIKSQLESGEITRKNAKEMLTKMRAEHKAELEIRKTEVQSRKAQLDALRSERNANRPLKNQ